MVNLPTKQNIRYAWEEQNRAPTAAETAAIVAQTPLDGFADLPDDEVKSNGRPDKGAIRQKYKGQSWDRPDVGDDT